MKNITLALGAGGTKGFAHIGVLKQLIKKQYIPSAIAGSSAGAIVGSLFAVGYSIEEIEVFAKELEYAKLFTRKIDDPPSLLGLGGLYKLLEKYLGDKTFNSTNIPFAVSTVDSNSGCEFIINSGKLIDAIKATTAVPGIFPPFIYKNYVLVDGGVLNPVPVNIARWLNDNVPVFAVSLSTPPTNWSSIAKYEIPTFFPIPQFVVHQFSQMRLGKAMELFTDSLELMMNMIAWLRLNEDKPDVIINPDVHRFTMIENVDVDEMIKLGESAVLEKTKDFALAFSITKRASRWIRASKPPGEILK